MIFYNINTVLWFDGGANLTFPEKGSLTATTVTQSLLVPWDLLSCALGSL